VPNRCYNDRSPIFVENHAPIDGSKPHTVAAFEALHIAVPGGCKLRQPLSMRRRTSGESFAHWRALVAVKAIGLMLEYRRSRY
jgi:hypothetical protein